MRALPLAAVAALALAAGLPSTAEPVVVQARFHADRAGLASLDHGLWQPLMAAYAANQLEDYLAVFAPDAVIASGDMPTLNPFPEWRRAVERRFLVRRNEAGRHRIEYRFTERGVYREWSSERGVMAETDPNETRYYEFHYFARRSDGQWRVTTAYRKRLPREAGAMAFAAAAAPGDYERF